MMVVCSFRVGEGIDEVAEAFPKIEEGRLRVGLLHLVVHLHSTHLGLVLFLGKDETGISKQQIITITNDSIHQIELELLLDVQFVAV